MNNSNGNPNSTSPLPCLVSIPPITLSRRHRLSATTVEPRCPISFSKPMAWINLEGRVVNANEASAARTIGGGLSDELAFAWDLFPPIHRFLIVAVIGVAAAQSKKDREIFNLKKSVELRDQLLSSMQEKLDNLCEQFNSSKENTVAAVNKLSTKDGELQLDETFGSERIKFVDCGCWHCDEHSSFCNEYMGALSRRASGGNEVLQYKSPFSNEDQEERRMSGLSDLASSVTSAADIQFNNLAVEQDVYNLKRDSEEKETTIKELTTLLNSSEVANSKRVSELEDIIRRKNTTISKLKKDLVVLEQKVMQLSRLRRPSFSASIPNEIQLPQMRDNLIYDMDSTTSPSSSDSDSSPVNNVQDLPVDVIMPIKSSESTIGQMSTPAKSLNSSGGLIERRSKFRSAGPLKEIPSYQKSNAASSSSQKQLSPRKDLKKSRRRSLNGTKCASANKRWV
ncbi:hypothetical protein MtrunA17_Chr2g0329061 [Medicago truncatula]|uniref:Uncharacterized protein n=1 Tax=Medicago truncatula TaxID=3880 RepID=G7IUE9_MEDTR|nr:uncharacterized protein LOC11421473 isoform X2 [Medicago truncatula]AES67714.2 hypothetical protein MTR_2g098330 [Medicago truncatula]RHN76163.1 hypothetical protein MtrunA17_Chr2g0329061 [Medicago truncatula]